MYTSGNIYSALFFLQQASVFSLPSQSDRWGLTSDFLQISLKNAQLFPTKQHLSRSKKRGGDKNRKLTNCKDAAVSGSLHFLNERRANKSTKGLFIYSWRLFGEKFGWTQQRIAAHGGDMCQVSPLIPSGPPIFKCFLRAVCHMDM